MQIWCAREFGDARARNREYPVLVARAHLRPLGPRQTAPVELNRQDCGSRATVAQLHVKGAISGTSTGGIERSKWGMVTQQVFQRCTADGEDELPLVPWRGLRAP